jgi:hypothetical protein
MDSPYRPVFWPILKLVFLINYEQVFTYACIAALKNWPVHGLQFYKLKTSINKLLQIIIQNNIESFGRYFGRCFCTVICQVNKHLFALLIFMADILADHTETKKQKRTIQAPYVEFLCSQSSLCDLPYL